MLQVRRKIFLNLARRHGKAEVAHGTRHADEDAPILTSVFEYDPREADAEAIRGLRHMRAQTNEASMPSKNAVLEPRAPNAKGKTDARRSLLQRD